jgi:hypothetical protein
MLYGGSSSSSHAYVTPLEDVFRDIKDFLHPMVIDVRVSNLPNLISFLNLHDSFSQVVFSYFI